MIIQIAKYISTIIYEKGKEFLQIKLSMYK